MININNEDFSDQNHNFSYAIASESRQAAVQNPNHMDDDTFHENPQEDEDAVSYGFEKKSNITNGYNHNTEGTEETDGNDDDDELKDDFNNFGLDQDFDTD
ncbi:hypothetical protein [Flavobacterium sp.]|uniref:hypothetical protein n=1 Tax=Flavobacterium sp. TaxID=239 RepID=UPI00261A6648|nr:hypothetical protein [Flavobacterium sp.]